MGQAVCRCGYSLTISRDTERLMCPSCGANIRVRRASGSGSTANRQLKGGGGGDAETGAGSPRLDPDGYFRFACACGRRFKLRPHDPEQPVRGECPTCQRPFSFELSPSAPPLGEDDPTGELSLQEREMIQQWILSHQPEIQPTAAAAPYPATTTPTATPMPTVNAPSTRIAEPNPAHAMPMPPSASALSPEPEPAISARSFGESGLRLCPNCKKPVHVAAVTCRSCGTSVPRRPNNPST